MALNHQQGPLQPGLSARLAGDFTRKIRDRGYTYFAQGLVKILKGDHAEVVACVRGSIDYRVHLLWQDQTLLANCDCPYFSGGEQCKHLWAVILAADARQHLLDAAMHPNLFAEYDFFDSGDHVGEDVDEEFLDTMPSPLPRKSAAYFPPVPKPPPPTWQARLSGIAAVQAQRPVTQFHWPESRQIVYIVDLEQSKTFKELVVVQVVRDPLPDGSWKNLIYNPLTRGQIAQLPSAEDREILSLMNLTHPYGWGYSAELARIPESCTFPSTLAEKVVAIAARTGRCYVSLDRQRNKLATVTWDDGEPWRLGMEMQRADTKGWEVAAVLRRGSDYIKLHDVLLVTRSGLLFTRDRAARVAQDTPFEVVWHLQSTGPIHAPESERDNVLQALLSLPGLPHVEVPEELRYEVVSQPGRPCLHIRAQTNNRFETPKLPADLSFDYEGRLVRAADPTPGHFSSETRRFVRRHAESEEAAASLLRALGVQYKKPTYYDPAAHWNIAPKKLPRVARVLVEAGWHIEAEGKIFRRPGAFHIEVASGIDWFELHADVEYGETTAQIPVLLEALRRGESIVRLDDGTYGLLPEEWLKRIGMLAGMGTPEEGHIRFRPSQAGLLDALLAGQAEATCDETFTRIRQELGQFRGIEPSPQPHGFVGRLRDYQREGVGWMEFLRRFAFGGCLADDMGVGKTAQVLAMLETRRERRVAGEALGPALIVVPRSLIFNWMEEAARFTPLLKVLDYTGLARDAKTLAGYDVILTTYGTLRRDIIQLNTLNSITSCSTKRKPSRMPPRNRPRQCGCCAAPIAWP